MTFEEIKESLTGLSQDELKVLSDMIMALRQLAGTKDPLSSKMPTLWSMAIERVHKALEIFGCPVPLFMVKAVANTNGFIEKIEGLDLYLNACKLNTQEKLAILTVGIDLVCRDLQNNGVGLTPRAICNCVHRIPMLLNKAFPGYARSGTLSMLLKTTTGAPK